MNLQKEFSKRVIENDCIKGNINNICGVDVAYNDNIAYCSALVLNRKTLEVIEIINYKRTVDNTYIPSLFMLRESKSILKSLKLIKNSYDVLLINAHGVLHPRLCGMACYIGIMVDKPTIGIAKKLLCGLVLKNNYVEYDGRVLGYRIKKSNKKEIFVSVGHKISLLTAINIIKELIKDNESFPEPLRLADIYSKKYKKLKF
ncbi:MAG: endonuclease V [Nitrososphaeraceae archaeon]